MQIRNDLLQPLLTAVAAFASFAGGAPSRAQDCHKPLAELKNPQTSSMTSSFGKSMALMGDRVVAGLPYYSEDGLDYVGIVEIHDLDRSPDDTYTIRSPRKAEFQEFGSSLDAWDAWIVVGDAEYLYFFKSENDEWVIHQEISLESAPQRIDVDEGIAVVGCPYRQDAQTNGGAAFVFEYRDSEDQWVQTQEIVGSQVGFDSGFGTGVDRQGNRLVVGGYGDNEFGRRAGDAYVFEYMGEEWIETARLTASDAQPDDYFGYEVLLLDDEIFVGAYGREVDSRNQGVVFRFQFIGDAWVEAEKFDPFTQHHGTLFGASLHTQKVLGKQILFVGCPAVADSDELGYFGDVYTYEKVEGEWLFVTRIPCPDITAGYSFGVPIVGRDGFVLIAATWASGDGRIFRYDERFPHWKLVKELAPVHGSADDNFAYSVAVKNSLLAVGAPGDNELGPDAGAVYVYRRSIDPGRWSSEATLRLSGSNDLTDFGENVVLLDDSIIASSRNMLHEFVHDGSQWSESSRFGRDEFVRSLVASQSLPEIVAGSPYVDGQRNREGAATIYRRTQPGGEWSEVQRLVPPEESAARYFGNHLSADKTFLVASATVTEEEPTEFFHTAFVYRYDEGQDEWVIFQQFAPDHTQHGSFSTTPVSLLLDGANSEVWIATGAESENNQFTSDGSVYLTVLNSETGDILREYKITAPAPVSNGNFGAEVRLGWIDGKAEVLVAETRNDGGLVHRYRLRNDRRGWELIASFRPDRSWSGVSYFGSTIAADDSTTMISDPGYRQYSGRLFAYELADCKCLDLTIENLIAGEDATISITGGNENEEFVVMWALKEGQYRLDASSWCADFGLQIPIGDPLSRLFVRSRFDAVGEYETTRRIPRSLSGREIYFQAAQKNTCPDDCTSNVFRAVISE